jgi:flavorubredoxin
MKACVVYESLYGNTAEVARAIAEGLGPDAVALTTDEATPAVLESADLVVAGSPVMAFGIPSDRMRATALTDAKAPRPADLAHQSMRSWLAELPTRAKTQERPIALGAAFETKLRWSPGGATGSIDKGLEQAGFRRLAKPEKFVVTGTYGPLREGELDRARGWGRRLAEAAEGAAPHA